MRKDFEDKILLFPFFDAASLGMSLETDQIEGRIYDTTEDCVMEMEELKNELSMIVVTQTNTGRERWDTPETKTGVGRKSRLRKDRYSALLMANMSARQIMVEKKAMEFGHYGGFAKKQAGEKEGGPLYHGPNWWTEKMGDIY
jgi:hypothetical protein